MTSPATKKKNNGSNNDDGCDGCANHLSELDALCGKKRITNLDDYPLAEKIIQNIVIYNGEICKKRIVVQEHNDNHNGADNSTSNGFRDDDDNDYDNNVGREELKKEWIKVMKDGPGVFVIKGAYSDLNIIDRCTSLFHTIIEEEEKKKKKQRSEKTMKKEQNLNENENESGGGGDHFGHNNIRIWNTLQKICILDPALYIKYYSHPLLALACEAWLGPNYQMTSQVNIVKFGNESQIMHCDYHLGFQQPSIVQQYPIHAQDMSQYLTLEGGIVHTNMSIESGPTKFLPYSQLLSNVYMAHHQHDIRMYFEQHYSQIPLSKGDMIFFNPAIFHAAGSNNQTSASTTRNRAHSNNNDRILHLFQVSSSFGRAMESINRHLMINNIYPVLVSLLLSSLTTTTSEAEEEKGDEGRTKRLQLRQTNQQQQQRLFHDIIAATAEGYSFPTNLDLDIPIQQHACAPETDAQIVKRALHEGWSLERLQAHLAECAKRRIP